MDLDLIVKRIEAKLETGVILFTGAGISKDCKDLQGNPLPLGNELAKEIWGLFGSLLRTEYDGSGLKETFGLAQRKKPKELAEFLNRRFTIDIKSVPDYYKRYIDFPWHKIYTLNIDNLFEVIERKYSPVIKINPISATLEKPTVNSYKTTDLIHLNGTTADAPNNVIFSIDDYATHQGIGHPYYQIFSNELNENMIIFIGSELDEEILWKHVNLRNLKSRDQRELRPESFLVTPSIKEAKRMLLEEKNITHIPMTASGFSDLILSKLENKFKDVSLRKKNRLLEIKKEVTVPLVQDLILKKEIPARRRHILLGFKPVWDDITNSRTILRSVENKIYSEIKEQIDHPQLEISTKNIFLLTGTAGDGKTTTLMRLAYHLSSDGISVGFLDPETNYFWNRLRNIVDSSDHLDVLIIDDVHVYQDKLINILNEVISLKKVCCIVISCRSNKVDTVLRFKNQLLVPLIEYNTEKLSDSEIEDLLFLLEKEDFLGVLKAMNFQQRFEILKSKQKLDRQLIVALIEATSGKDFKKWIKDEYSDLGGIKKKIYAILAIANNFDTKLSSNELALASQEPNLDFLNSINEMLQRGLIIKTPTGYFSVRHRVIAKNVYDQVIEDGNAHIYFESICRMSAIIAFDTKLTKNRRIKSLAKICLGHDRLLVITKKNINKINEVYDNLKELFSEEHHFWLQRAAVEIEIGELHFAQSHISTALSLAPDDPLILITKCHLDLKKEVQETYDDDSKARFLNTIEKLKDIIPSRAKVDPKPYHIIGSQSLNWANAKISIKEEKKKFLYSIKGIVEEGVREFPTDEMLRSLNEDIQKTILLTTT